MISNELLLTDTNSEFVRVRFEFVVIYFSIPAAPFGLHIPGARLISAPRGLVVRGLAGAFRLFLRALSVSIDALVGGCRWGVGSGNSIIHSFRILCTNIAYRELRFLRSATFWAITRFFIFLCLLHILF